LRSLDAYVRYTHRAIGKIAIGKIFAFVTKRCLHEGTFEM